MVTTLAKIIDFHWNKVAKIVIMFYFTVFIIRIIALSVNERGMFMGNNKESKTVIGDKLQHLLKINGFNTASLIEGTNIDESTLQDYLNNVKSPTLEDIVQLAKFLNTSLDYMIGTSDFILDSWDYDFLEEFLQFSSKKIREHFEDRQNIKVPDGDELDTVLFGLLTYITLSRSGRSFEDLSDDEISIKKESFTEIISIFNSCIIMSNQDCFDIK